MKATAFAPGHISGFFEPVYKGQDLGRSGSRGSGVNISLGAISQVTVERSTQQEIEVYVNNKKSNAKVTQLAIKYLIGETPLKINVNTLLDLPMGQGFGMSGAGALSATYALAKNLQMQRQDALKASHFAEVQLRTGLGDVLASSFGGIEIRKEPGLPPWGLIEHIPGECEFVLCIIGDELDTKKILTDATIVQEIVYYGRYCTKKILENPTIENLLTLSQIFAKKTGLTDEKVQNAINATEKSGKASMCMLGNSVFAMGDTQELCKILTSFGKVFVCKVDQAGARVLE